MIVLRRQVPGSVPPVREQIGVLEEYFSGPGLGNYLGKRKVPEASQLFGANNATEVTMEEDTIIDRSFSKKRTLKRGTKVVRICYPLEGREK